MNIMTLLDISDFSSSLLRSPTRFSGYKLYITSACEDQGGNSEGDTIHRLEDKQVIPVTFYRLNYIRKDQLFVRQ